MIARSNQHALYCPNNGVFQSNYVSFHNNLLDKVNHQYYLNSGDILSCCANGTYISHEMAIEAGLLFQLSMKEQATVSIFGEWDYLSHQVIASPFKPIDYMDKMDIFGYTYVKGFDRTKSKYLIIEVKKDIASCDCIDQLMKYVDWVKDEYCFGDYSMIKAYLVAFDFPSNVINYARQIGERKYIIGRRPARSGIWSDLTLVKYTFNSETGLLEFQQV